MPVVPWICPVCGHGFGLREARCEDRRDPLRSFGCPHCGTFLARRRTHRLRWRCFLPRFAGLLCVAGALLVLLAVTGWLRVEVSEHFAPDLAAPVVTLVALVLLRRIELRCTESLGPALVPVDALDEAERSRLRVRP